MTSFCRPAQPCPALATGYNVCIENDTEVDQVYQFGDLDETGADFVVSQSVTVPRNTSICYRILSPLGKPVLLRLEDPLGGEPVIAGFFTCSVHITTRTVVSVNAGTITAAFFTTLDCSPCPCPCEFSCAPEKKTCSVTGAGSGLGFGIMKKLVELCMDTHGCPDAHLECPVSDVAGSDSWIFADN